MELCECGCGEEVTHPGNRFIQGHWLRGDKNPMRNPLIVKKWMDSNEERTLSEEHTNNIGISLHKYYIEHPGSQVGENNGNWNPDRSQTDGYPAELRDIESLVREGRTSCEECGKLEEDNGRQLDRHHVDEDKMNNDLNNFRLLCISCHAKLSARLRKQHLLLI